MRLIVETLAAFVATFGFGILFNIKGHRLYIAAIGGALAWFIYKVLLGLGASELFSLFTSSLIFSTYSEILARIVKTPVTTFVVCALIPLVPGSGMYNTMLHAIQGNVDLSLQIGISTLSSAGTLALGVIFVSSITRLITGYRHHNIS